MKVESKWKFFFFLSCFFSPVSFYIYICNSFRTTVAIYFLLARGNLSAFFGIYLQILGKY